MGGCAAINCTNHSRKGHRMFVFPSNPERRKKWIVNCRRDSWIPGPGAQLCSEHFEDSQYEKNRADGWKKLKLTAVPTLFNIPNAPNTITPKRVKGFGNPKPGSVLDGHLNDAQQIAEDPLSKRIAELEAENSKLRQQISDKGRCLNFLSAEQVQNAALDKKSIQNWSDKSITEGLKMRFAVGKFGYNYMRATGYPCPSYSTLNRRMQNIDMNFGILHVILNAMKSKVSYMSETDRWCSVMVDEMEISASKDFDVSAKHFIGGVTLGSNDVPGKHYTVVLVRGLKTQWKQVIAHEVTGPSTSGQYMHALISTCISACHEIGLIAKALVSDMGSNNKAMWKQFNISVTKDGRKTSFISNNSEVVYTVADVPHLLKNLRNATLSKNILLPNNICAREGLPYRCISAGFIKHLWIREIESETSLRSLHHLNKEHLFPSHFQKMNVATAVQLFSVTTAAALEKAVRLRTLRKEALATAWWIRFIHEWFSIMTARHRIKSITVNNKEEKFKFLQDVIDVVQDMEFGIGWKPLQTGIIMSTLSVMNLANEAFERGFKFFMPGRLSQDALENVFSQVRRKAGAKPTALRAKMALKLICVSQFIADLKGTNYAPENDFHLFNLSKECVKKSPGPSHTEMSSNPLTPSEENDVYYITGATLNGVLKQKLCEECIQCAKTAIDKNEPDMPQHLTLLTEYSDMGGLMRPTSGIYRICREAERLFQRLKGEWIKKEQPITEEHLQIIKQKCERIEMPDCCNLKEKIINYYLIIRCKSTLKHLKNKVAYSASFSSLSAQKKS